MKADVLGMTFACRNSDHWCRMEANTGTVLAISGIVGCAEQKPHLVMFVLEARQLSHNGLMPGCRCMQ